jgi:predicted Zn finger-like uncharacterized protein
MILTCPECATGYFVDDSRIPSAGRTVKCTSCGARWTARRESGFEAEPPEPDQLAELRDEPVAPAAAMAPEPALATTLEPEIEAVPAVEPAPRPKAPARPATAARTEARASAMLWAGMAATVAVVIVAAIVFRQDVVRLWPKSSAAYAGLGLPVNGAGLVIEAVHAEPTFLGGRPVLSVTGAIRNARDDATQSPAIRISLLNRAGQPVAAKIARPIDARIPGHARRHFAIAILDPPSNAHDLEVTFEAPDAKAAKSAKIAPHAAEAVLTPTPAPIEAQPLPSGSPDALPDHG